MDTQNLFVKGLENISQNSNNDVNDKTYVGVIIDIIGTKNMLFDTMMQNVNLIQNIMVLLLLEI